MLSLLRHGADYTREPESVRKGAHITGQEMKKVRGSLGSRLGRLTVGTNAGNIDRVQNQRVIEAFERDFMAANDPKGKPYGLVSTLFRRAPDA